MWSVKEASNCEEIEIRKPRALPLVLQEGVSTVPTTRPFPPALSRHSRQGRYASSQGRSASEANTAATGRIVGVRVTCRETQAVEQVSRW